MALPDWNRSLFLTRLTRLAPLALLGAASIGAAQAQTGQPLILDRSGQTVVLEAYAPNIIRVTLSTIAEEAKAKPGYGFLAQPSATGWQHSTAANGADVYASGRIRVTVAPTHKRDPNAKLPDTAAYFRGSVPGVGITFDTPDGQQFLDMEGWQMAEPNHKDMTAEVLHDRRPTDPPFFTVGATFLSPPDEHYYGLGQNHQGYLDHRGHPVVCESNYLAPAAPSWCVPFLVTNKGYGLLWDNPSSTTIEPGFNEQTKWISKVGRRVSYFVIAGKTTDEIYGGYRLLTGATPMLPKAAYGLIQCKQRYSTQAEVMAVANGYRERHLPLDMIVVDWFYYTKMGQFDFKSYDWPDPTEMNKQLHAMGIDTMISVWPRFTTDDRFYNQILKNGWFIHLADGTPINGLPYDKAGSDIDTTNPDAAKFYWSLIKDNLVSRGFDDFWTDETEPDLPPNGSYYHIGPGTEYFNLYPLLHTAAVYDGFRRDEHLPNGEGKRVAILSRDAYTGAQRNGTLFWSSDIFPLWDTMKRQIPVMLDVAASGIAYNGNDIGGWQDLPYKHVPAHPPLIDPSDAREVVHHYDDYPELYVRWYEWGAFQPNFRTHGTREHNEVWSYGKQAEPILEKYLKLRYELMPYTYSLGWFTHETGAPFVRALFMDFPSDPNINDPASNAAEGANIAETLRYEYMYGPSLLIAPVTEQGATSRQVYLPAGNDWYNYWTNERVHGGQMVTVQAPIDTLPIFVKAGSILPTGTPVNSTHDDQKLAKLKIYPGANADFTLYNDDGISYAYEQGKHAITKLHWDDASGKLTHEGATAWTGPEEKLVEVVGK
jgi:alpha-D-xyloside xylohydrolase